MSLDIMNETQAHIWWVCE